MIINLSATFFHLIYSAENPCALIDCLPHYTCQVDPSTEDGVCVPSCDVDNGGCPSNEVCVVKEYGIECFKPPHGNV